MGVGQSETVRIGPAGVKAIVPNEPEIHTPEPNVAPLRVKYDKLIHIGGDSQLRRAAVAPQSLGKNARRTKTILAAARRAEFFGEERGSLRPAGGR